MNKSIGPQAGRNGNGRGLRFWIAAILLLLQFFFLVSAEPVVRPGFEFRWYHQLVLSLVAYLSFGKTFSWRAVGKFRWMYVLIVAGLLLSGLRTPNVDTYQLGVIGYIVGLFTFMLLIPLFADRDIRRLLFFGFLLVALLRTVVVYDFSLQTEDFTSILNLTGRGKDKNFSGLLMGIGVMLLVTTLVLRADDIKTAIRVSAVRLLALSVAFGLLVFVFLSGSRSSLLATLLALSIWCLMWVSMKGLRSKLTASVFVPIAVISVAVTFAALLDWSGYLQFTYLRLEGLGATGAANVTGRVDLVERGIYYVAEDPIVGVGPGVIKELDGGLSSATAGFLIHNEYLTDWVELGMAGFLKGLLFVVFVITELKYQWRWFQQRGSNFFDLALMLGFVTYLLMRLTLDMSTMTIFMISLLNGFTYERNQWALRGSPTLAPRRIERRSGRASQFGPNILT